MNYDTTLTYILVIWIHSFVRSQRVRPTICQLDKYGGDRVESTTHLSPLSPCWRVPSAPLVWSVSAGSMQTASAPPAGWTHQNTPTPPPGTDPRRCAPSPATKPHVTKCSLKLHYDITVTKPCLFISSSTLKSPNLWTSGHFHMCNIKLYLKNGWQTILF